MTLRYGRRYGISVVRSFNSRLLVPWLAIALIAACGRSSEPEIAGDVEPSTASEGATLVPEPEPLPALEGEPALEEQEVVLAPEEVPLGGPLEEPIDTLPVPRSPHMLENEAVLDTVVVPADDDAEFLLPRGARIEVELKTPLHSATTRVGDRFAARVMEPIMIGDRVIVPTRSLVEGRVWSVISADDADSVAMIALDFRTITLADGRRLPLDAEITTTLGEATTREEPMASPSALDIAAGAATGAAMGQVLGGTESAVAGAIVGGVTTAAIFSTKQDHEVIVPSGTTLTITLQSPLLAVDP